MEKVLRNVRRTDLGIVPTTGSLACWRLLYQYLVVYL